MYRLLYIYIYNTPNNNIYVTSCHRGWGDCGRRDKALALVCIHHVLQLLLCPNETTLHNRCELLATIPREHLQVSLQIGGGGQHCIILKNGDVDSKVVYHRLHLLNVRHSGGDGFKLIDEGVGEALDLFKQDVSKN